MRIASTRGERTIEELVERLYLIEGRGAVAAARRARKALLALNPQLSEPAEVDEGAAILVPEVSGARAVGEELSPAQTTFEVPVGDGGAAFERAMDSFGRAIAEERDDARRARTLLRSRRLKAAAKDVPGAAEELERALAGAEGRLEDAKAFERYRRKLIAMASEDIARSGGAGRSGG